MSVGEIQTAYQIVLSPGGRPQQSVAEASAFLQNVLGTNNVGLALQLTERTYDMTTIMFGLKWLKDISERILKNAADGDLMRRTDMVDLLIGSLRTVTQKVKNNIFTEIDQEKESIINFWSEVVANTVYANCIFSFATNPNARPVEILDLLSTIMQFVVRSSGSPRLALSYNVLLCKVMALIIELNGRIAEIIHGFQKEIKSKIILEMNYFVLDFARDVVQITLIQIHGLISQPSSGPGGLKPIQSLSGILLMSAYVNLVTKTVGSGSKKVLRILFGDSTNSRIVKHGVQSYSLYADAANSGVSNIKVSDAFNLLLEAVSLISSLYLNPVVSSTVTNQFITDLAKDINKEFILAIEAILITIQMDINGVTANSLFVSNRVLSAQKSSSLGTNDISLLSGFNKVKTGRASTQIYGRRVTKWYSNAVEQEIANNGLNINSPVSATGVRIEVDKVFQYEFLFCILSNPEKIITKLMGLESVLVIGNICDISSLMANSCSGRIKAASPKEVIDIFSHMINTSLHSVPYNPKDPSCPIDNIFPDSVLSCYDVLYHITSVLSAALSLLVTVIRDDIEYINEIKTRAGDKDNYNEALKLYLMSELRQLLSCGNFGTQGVNQDPYTVFSYMTSTLSAMVNILIVTKLSPLLYPIMVVCDSVLCFASSVSQMIKKGGPGLKGCNFADMIPLLDNIVSAIITVFKSSNVPVQLAACITATPPERAKVFFIDNAKATPQNSPDTGATGSGASGGLESSMASLFPIMSFLTSTALLSAKWVTADGHEPNYSEEFLVNEFRLKTRSVVQRLSGLRLGGNGNVGLSGYTPADTSLQVVGTMYEIVADSVKCCINSTENSVNAGYNFNAYDSFDSKYLDISCSLFETSITEFYSSQAGFECGTTNNDIEASQAIFTMLVSCLDQVIGTKIPSPSIGSRIHSITALIMPLIISQALGANKAVIQKVVSSGKDIASFVPPFDVNDTFVKAFGSLPLDTSQLLPEVDISNEKVFHKNLKPSGLVTLGVLSEGASTPGTPTAGAMSPKRLSQGDILSIAPFINKTLAILRDAVEKVGSNYIREHRALSKMGKKTNTHSPSGVELQTIINRELGLYKLHASVISPQRLIEAAGFLISGITSVSARTALSLLLMIRRCLHQYWMTFAKLLQFPTASDKVDMRIFPQIIYSIQYLDVFIGGTNFPTTNTDSFYSPRHGIIDASTDLLVTSVCTSEFQKYILGKMISQTNRSPSAYDAILYNRSMVEYIIDTLSFGMKQYDLQDCGSDTTVEFSNNGWGTFDSGNLCKHLATGNFDSALVPMIKSFVVPNTTPINPSTFLLLFNMLYSFTNIILTDAECWGISRGYYKTLVPDTIANDGVGLTKTSNLPLPLLADGDFVQIQHNIVFCFILRQIENEAIKYISFAKGKRQNSNPNMTPTIGSSYDTTYYSSFLPCLSFFCSVFYRMEETAQAKETNILASNPKALIISGLVPSAAGAVTEANVLNMAMRPPRSKVDRMSFVYTVDGGELSASKVVEIMSSPSAVGGGMGMGVGGLGLGGSPPSNSPVGSMGGHGGSMFGSQSGQLAVYDVLSFTDLLINHSMGSIQGELASTGLREESLLKGADSAMVPQALGTPKLPFHLKRMMLSAIKKLVLRLIQVIPMKLPDSSLTKQKVGQAAAMRESNDSIIDVMSRGSAIWRTYHNSPQAVLNTTTGNDGSVLNSTGHIMPNSELFKIFNFLPFIDQTTLDLLSLQNNTNNATDLYKMQLGLANKLRTFDGIADFDVESFISNIVLDVGQQVAVTVQTYFKFLQFLATSLKAAVASNIIYSETAVSSPLVITLLFRLLRSAALLLVIKQQSVMNIGVSTINCILEMLAVGGLKYRHPDMPGDLHIPQLNHHIKKHSWTIHMLLWCLTSSVGFFTSRADASILMKCFGNLYALVYASGEDGSFIFANLPKSESQKPYDIIGSLSVEIDLSQVGRMVNKPKKNGKKGGKAKELLGKLCNTPQNAMMQTGSASSDYESRAYPHYYRYTSVVKKVRNGETVRYFENVCGYRYDTADGFRLKVT